MGADHPVAWCKDYRGGRSFYTSGSTSAIGTETAFADHLAGAVEWSSGVARQRLQRLRRDGPGQLRADQDQRAPEPERAHRLRPAPGRPGHPDRPRRPGPAARPGSSAPSRSSRRSPSTRTARTGSTAPRSTTTSRSNHWVYLFYAPPDRHRGAVGRRHPHDHHPHRKRAHHGGGPVGLGPLARLLPALAVQVRRRPHTLARPGLGAEDPPGPQQPGRLLPRRW